MILILTKINVDKPIWNKYMKIKTGVQTHPKIKSLAKVKKVKIEEAKNLNITLIKAVKVNSKINKVILVNFHKLIMISISKITKDCSLFRHKCNTRYINKLKTKLI